MHRRLDHLVDLGVDALWLSPFYPSPMVDFGYDITDHTDVDPVFGTLDDVDRLVAAAHAVGLRVLVDLVPCHTSDQHPWFVASRSSRTDAKRNWYVWRDPAPDGGPPNNWVSEFGGPAWTLDPHTGQYYLHLFLSAQPSLNWREPAVVDAMREVLTFWLDRGIDGFRVDAIEYVVVDERLRDDPPDPAWTPDRGPARRLLRDRSGHQPGAIEVARELRRTVDRYPDDRVLVGEAYGTLDQVLAYHGGPALDGFHLPFNFQLLGAQWEAATLARTIEDYERALPPGAWPNWVLGNHDRSRIASRVGSAQARVAAVLLLTLRGTPTIYQGDELGMRDVPIPPDAVQDPWERQVPGLGLGRDPVRTPIPWGDGPARGFTSGEPWLPVGTDVASVAHQRDDPHSQLSLYRRLLALRRTDRALVLGSYRTVHVDAQVLAYERRHGDRCLGVELNLTGRPAAAALDGTTLLSTHPGGARTAEGQLRADEARVVLRG